MRRSMSEAGPAKFKVGDVVIYTNDYGVCWGCHMILEVEYDKIRGWLYYIDPTETPWYGVPERCLSELPPKAKGEGGEW